MVQGLRAWGCRGVWRSGLLIGHVILIDLLQSLGGDVWMGGRHVLIVRPGLVLRHATARLCAGDVPWRLVLSRRPLPL